MVPLNSTQPPTAFALASTGFSPACRARRASETDATVPSLTEPATDAVDHRRAGRMLNHDRVSPAIRVQTGDEVPQRRRGCRVSRVARDSILRLRAQLSAEQLMRAAQNNLLIGRGKLGATVVRFAREPKKGRARDELGRQQVRANQPVVLCVLSGTSQPP